MTLTIFLTFSFYSLGDELPEGWIKTGSHPAGFDAETVSNQGQNPPVALLKSNDRVTDSGFGTVMQQFFPKAYLGKRVKMTVLMKSESIEKWAGAWLRIDGKSANTIAFDNMENRPLKGTTDWQKYVIVLDVSQSAVSMNYGVLLTGSGQVWFDDFEFEVVSNNVKVTNEYKKILLREHPINNSF